MLKMRESRCHLACVLAALSIACSGVSADDQTPAATVSADKPRIMADCSGALREIAIHYVPNLATELESTYDDLLSALPVDVHVQVICSSDEAADAFDDGWGGDERERGRCVDVINVDRPITVWARDRRIGRVFGLAGLPAPALIPRDCSHYSDDHRNDLFISYLLEQNGVWSPGEDTPLHLEGGNLVANDRHVFVGANVLKDNADLGKEPAAVKRELLASLGRPCILVGDDEQRTPWCHVDMYVTPIDDHTVLVASTAVADMLVSSRAGFIDELAGLLDPEDCLSFLTRRGNRFDAIAAQLAEYGYDVIRLPALADPGEEWMVTYNNVLMEERDGRRIVYLPTYDLPVLDQAAEAVYRGLGFEIHRIDVSEVFQYGGAVRCLTNVISRDWRFEPAATPGNACPLTDPPEMSARSSAERASAPIVGGAVAASTAPWFPISSAIWLPLFIFCARILDVSIGTVRLVCIMRGRQFLAIALALVEVTIWLLAVASVITHLNNWLNVVAYISGFTLGNALGMWLERQLALGAETVILISKTKGQEIATRLREAHVRLTTLSGCGRDGAVELCLAVVSRKTTPFVLSLAKAVDPEVIATVEDVRHTSVSHAGRVGPGNLPILLSRAMGPWKRNGQCAAAKPAHTEQAA